MEKKKALQRWIASPANQPILPHFTPLPADAKGSTFGACGIRISGNPEFIDAVLSRLKDVIEAESGATRLHFGRNPVKPVFDKQWKNADTDSEVCYLQIRERTARTRQRKVRENSDTLPNFAISEEEEGILLDSTNETEPTSSKSRESKSIGTPAAKLDAPREQLQDVKDDNLDLHNGTGIFVVDPFEEDEIGE